jgi:hypothetical protein
MRMSPAQIAIALITNSPLPPFRGLDEGTPAQRIRAGRQWLMRMTGVDCGYDLQRWHETLAAMRVGGYHWVGKRSGTLPACFIAALQDPEWLAAVAELEAMESERNANAARDPQQ